MKQSEKILLGVLAVVCLYAGYLILFDEAKTTAKVEQVAAQFKTFVQTMQSKLDEKALTPAESYTLKILTAEVPTSPFYASNAQFYFEEDEATTEVPTDVLYSGYLRLGDMVYAIINNVEYSVGDTLMDNDMRVVSIGKEFVSLERVDPNTGRISSRKIPLVEDEMDQITLRRASQ